uniref:probable E3 ubiquitin-protein ligase RNF217 n=1 Tax=Erigeron canadensis TaxID=72917 RepID=UPI001CB94E31|nr:probable E3 ubiquitin-protein ligase RNF217 [Erigeron canadensis]
MGNAVAKPQQNPHQDPQNQQQEEEDATFTCEICIEPVSLPNIKFNNNNLCAHHFCTDCIIKYIKVKLEENVSDIKCPAMTCQHSIEPLSCRPKLTRRVFEKWCDVLCESSVLRVDGVYCPNIKCGELILNECGDTNLKRCVCSYCKKPYCFRCIVPWHDSSTCVEVEDENDVAFEHVSKRNKWQRCPVCRHCIERISGCNAVKCRCGIQFCYICGSRGCVCNCWWTIPVGWRLLIVSSTFLLFIFTLTYVCYLRAYARYKNNAF